MFNLAVLVVFSGDLLSLIFLIVLLTIAGILINCAMTAMYKFIRKHVFKRGLGVNTFKKQTVTTCNLGYFKENNTPILGGVIWCKVDVNLRYIILCIAKTSFNVL